MQIMNQKVIGLESKIPKTIHLIKEWGFDTCTAQVFKIDLILENKFNGSEFC